MSSEKPEIFVIKTSPKAVLQDYGKLMDLTGFSELIKKTKLLLLF